MVSKAGFVFNWENLAMVGGEMPDGLPWPDQIAFLVLRELYSQVKRGVIDRDTAVKEKRILIREYNNNVMMDNARKEWVRIVRETEFSKTEYIKNRTLENADKIVCAIDGLRRKQSDD